MVTAAAGLSAGNRMGCSDLASRSCWDICGSSTGLQPPSRYQNTPSCLQPPSSQEFVDESQGHYESCACLWWITQITTKLHLLCLCNFSQKKNLQTHVRPRAQTMSDGVWLEPICGDCNCPHCLLLRFAAAAASFVPHGTGRVPDAVHVKNCRGALALQVDKVKQTGCDGAWK